MHQHCLQVLAVHRAALAEGLADGHQVALLPRSRSW